jgi:hypothetical protein
VSEYIGTTYRQLHRAFQQLIEDEIILRSNKRIKIIDADRLSELAGTIYGDSYAE